MSSQVYQKRVAAMQTPVQRERGREERLGGNSPPQPWRKKERKSRGRSSTSYPCESRRADCLDHVKPGQQTSEPQAFWISQGSTWRNKNNLIAQDSRRHQALANSSVITFEKPNSTQKIALPGCSTRKQMLSEEVAACALNPVLACKLSSRLFRFSLQVNGGVCVCVIPVTKG